MKKSLQRWIGLLLALCLLTLPLFAVCAEEGSAPEPTAVPATPTPAPTPAPTAAPTQAPTPEPETPAPTAEPTAAPEVTNAPTDVPADVPPADAPDVPTDDPTEIPAAEPTREPEVENMPLALDAPVAIEVEKPYAIEGGVLTVTKNMTAADLAAAIAEEGGVSAIIISKDAELGGEGKIALPVLNNGTISGGTFPDKVKNCGTISGGTYEGIVYNGEEQKEPEENPDPNATEPPAPKEGAITGGTFTKDSTLYNYWRAVKAEISGTINAYYASTMSDCTYGDSAKVGNTPPEGSITVKYKANGTEYTASYGAKVLETLEKLASDSPWYQTDSASKKLVTTQDTFGLQTLSYVQEKNLEPTTAPSSSATTKPTATAKPTATPAPTLASGSSASGSYSWESSVASSNGGVEEEESGYNAETELVDNILRDGDRVDLGIVSDADEKGTAYELVVIPGESAETEDIGLIPGEANADGTVPAMVFVRAKGIGTESRTLTLTLSQIKRMAEEQNAEVLLFRNGSATVSLNTSALLEGGVPKLASLMRAWAYNETDFAEYDLAQIDFDAIQTGAEPTEEELREFEFRLTIAPAVPVGYDVRAELWLGENSKEISLLLGKMGITLHAQTATEDVAVYYMNEAQERYLLESHRGVVPGIADAIEGYEVVFVEGEYAVLTLKRSVSENEFAGLCAVTGDQGTYYIGILPTAG